MISSKKYVLKRGKRDVKNAGLSIVALVVLGFMSACTGTKKVAKTTEPVKETTKPAETLKPEQFLSHVIDWNSFSGKADIHFENKDQNQDFVSTIKMQKGKQIYANAVALGIYEAARALITPDSLKAVVRLNKSVYLLSYQDGLKLIQAQVDFSVLQNLFIGNPLITDVPVKNFEIKDSTVIITQVKDDFTQVLTYNKVKGTLGQLSLKSSKRNFECTIAYSKYGPITNQQPFASNRNVEIHNEGQTIKLNMEYNKAELNVPVEINFSIPDNYKKMDVSTIK